MYKEKYAQPSAHLVDQRTPFDRFIEAIAVAALIYIWAFTIYIFQILPEKIPIRFDAMGVPEGVLKLQFLACLALLHLLISFFLLFQN